MIQYTLTRKKVKNINLRVKPDGNVYVSANPRVPKSKIDEFVNSRLEWIETAKRRVRENAVVPSKISDEKCLELFNAVSDRIYPVFKKYLKQKPLLKVKNMKSCWGVCHYKKGYITLNKSLAEKPFAAVEYVVLHEYIHFLEQNHGDGFYKIMSELMPDYKKRRKLLKNA